MAVNDLKQLSSSIMLKVDNRFDDSESISGFPIAAPKNDRQAAPCGSAGCSPSVVQLPLRCGAGPPGSELEQMPDALL